MNSEEVIHLIRHYRHDMLNQLQLMKGYASMNRLDKVQEKMEQTILLARQEAKISDLNIPSFALWVIQFNWHYQNFRLTYHVDVEKVDLTEMDSILYSTCHEMMNLISEHMDVSHLYDVMLHIHHQQTTKFIFTFAGEFLEMERLKTALLTKTLIKAVNITKDEQTNMEIVMEIEKKR